MAPYSKQTPPVNDSQSFPSPRGNQQLNQPRNLHSNQDGSVSNKKKVGFQDVEIREYELDLCDNPACGLGPAIGIGWSYKEKTKEDIDSFEDKRPPKRSSTEFKMDRECRESIMENSRFSKKEIRICTQDKAKIKNGRESTAGNMPFAKYEEKLESAQRKLRRIVLRQKKDEELLKLWPEYEGIMEGERLSRSERHKRRSISKLVLYAYKDI